MASFGSRSGEAGARALPLMFAAFVVAGGFFTWLYFQAVPVEVEVVEGGVVEEVMATVVAIDDFGVDPLAHAGMVIELHRLGVQSVLTGEEAFFVVVPNQPSGYLIKSSLEVVPIGGDLEFNATVSVTGMVHAMTDSVKDAWVASGAIQESDRILADFAESFLEARAVSVTAPPPPEDN